MRRQSNALSLIRVVAILAVAATLLAAGTWIIRSKGSSQIPIRNVLLISIDTCRADHLSCYGYPKPTTPNIDSIAREGILFQNAISPIPQTFPGHSSMLTGTIPPVHGVHDNNGYQFVESNVTLAEILKDNGFATGAIISAAPLDGELGLDQGFDIYNDQFDEELNTVGIVERRGEEASRYATTFLQEIRDRPFFLFLHFYDPHAQYNPPEPFVSQFAENRYAGEIAYVDQCVGQVIDTLKSLSQYESTLIIITSDHGEMLGEHGESTHAFFIYQSAIRVPLIFRLPGGKYSRVVSELTGIIDIVPTVCHLLDIEPPGNIQGVNILGEVAHEEKSARQRSMYCESLLPTKYNGNSLLGLVTERWKYIQTTRPELYDLSRDPQEARDLSDQEPLQARQMADALKELLESLPVVGGDETTVEVDHQRTKRLEGLGYIAGSIVQDFTFNRSKEDPKDLIEFHAAIGRLIGLRARKKYEQAKQLAEKLITQRPNFVNAYVQMAQVVAEQGDHAAAVVHFSQALKLDPERADVHAERGNALVALDRLDEAISHYRRAISLDDKYADAHHNLGSALEKQGQVDEATSHYQMALQLDPQLAEAHFNLGRALNSQGKSDASIEHFRAGLEVKPDQRAYLSLADALVKQGENEQAIEAYRNVLQMEGDTADVHHLIAQAFKRIDQESKAVEHFRKALLAQEDSPVVLNSLAWILATSADPAIRSPQEGLRLAEHADELVKRGNPALLDTLAAALAANGRFDEAIEVAEKALELMSDHDDTKQKAQVRSRLEGYQNGRPYIESAP